MALPTFHLKGNSLDAYTAMYNGKARQAFDLNRGAHAVVVGSGPNLGDAYISFADDSTANLNVGLIFDGGLNIPTSQGLTLVASLLVPTNIAQQSRPIIQTYSVNRGSNPPNADAFGFSIFDDLLDGNSQATIRMTNFDGTTGVNNFSVAFPSILGTRVDFVVHYPGTTESNGYKIYLNNSLIGQTTASQTWDNPRHVDKIMGIALGFYANVQSTRFRLYELALIPGIVDVENFEFEDGTFGPLLGASRTKYLKSSGVRADRHDDPGAEHVRSTRPQYYSAGVLQTPSLVVPSLANTKIGVPGDGGVGTYDGSDRFEVPTATDIRFGVQAKNNSLTPNVTGTLEAISVLQSDLKGKPGPLGVKGTVQ